MEQHVRQGLQVALWHILTTQLGVLVTSLRSAPHLSGLSFCRQINVSQDQVFGKNRSTVAWLGGLVSNETNIMVTVEQTIIAATGINCQ